MYVVHSGEVDYEEALRWQRLLVAAREADEIPDVILTLTHPPIYTAGRRADIAAHVLNTSATRSIPVVRVDRGGDVTYHGPGQLVVYPIRRLPHAKAVRAHVEMLEESVVATARSLGVNAVGATTDRVTRFAAAVPPRTGVWVDRAKLAAIGIKVNGRTTSHGIAVNVGPNLGHFDGIVACGLPDAAACSFASLGVATDLDDVRSRVTAHMARLLNQPLQVMDRADIGL